ncbi:DNA helicase [Sarracenia purpurea var. burkii]
MLLLSEQVVLNIFRSDNKQGQYVFDMPTVANSIGVSAVDVLNHLQKLKSRGEITYEMKDPAYCYTIVDVPKDFCSLVAHLTKWLFEVETCKVQKIDAMFNAAASAVQKCKKINGCHDTTHTPCLQKMIFEYFNGDDDNNVPKKMDQSSPFLRADIKVFLQSNSQAKFTPRAVARIMHGIASPAYPLATWSKTHFCPIWMNKTSSRDCKFRCILKERLRTGLITSLSLKIFIADLMKSVICSIFPCSLVRAMNCHFYLEEKLKFLYGMQTATWGRYSHVNFQAVMEAARAELMNFVRSDYSELANGIFEPNCVVTITPDKQLPVLIYNSIVVVEMELGHHGGMLV